MNDIRSNRAAREAGENYAHQSWPAWYYGPEGQSQIFNNPLEVPEGWHDSPDKVGKAGAKTTIPGYDEAVAAAEAAAARDDDEEQFEVGHDKRVVDNDDEDADRKDVETVNEAAARAEAEGRPSEPGQVMPPLHTPISSLPPIDKISKKEILDRLVALKIAHNPSWKDARLYALLADHLRTANSATGEA